MQLSEKTVETLVDLVEIKLSCFEIYDREDRRTQVVLQDCLKELSALAGTGIGGQRDLALLR